jgi:hypothetical protein
MPLTMVSVCALALPVRGRLETILTTGSDDGPSEHADKMPSSNENLMNNLMQAIVPRRCGKASQFLPAA